MSIAPETPWSGVDTSDVPVDEPLEVNTSPDAILAPEGETGLAEGESIDAPVEDPDAWRNVRISDHAGENYALIAQLAEKPEFKRALHTYAAQTVRKETQAQIDAAIARAEKAEADAALARKAFGDQVYGSMTQEQLDMVRRNPRGLAGLQAYEKLKEQVTQPQQQVPSHVREMHNEINDMLTEAALHIPEDEMEQLRRNIINPTTYQKYQNAPHQLIRELDNWLDNRINGTNNKGVQPAAMSRPAPARSADQAPLTPVVRGNSTVDRMAPDATPRSGNNGRFAKTYGPSEIANMDPEEFDRVLAAHNATSSLDLRKLGVFRDRD